MHNDHILPKRKKLRLENYDYSLSGAYFITICTHQKQILLNASVVGNDLSVVPSNTPQNQIIEKWLFELENKFDVSVVHYVIMPDHIHFILFISDTERHVGRSLPEILQWYKTMTTNEYIALVKADILKPFDKKLWQKSYYEHIIRDKEDYLTRVRYILNNPFKSNP